MAYVEDPETGRRFIKNDVPGRKTSRRQPPAPPAMSNNRRAYMEALMAENPDFVPGAASGRDRLKAARRRRARTNPGNKHRG